VLDLLYDHVKLIMIHFELVNKNIKETRIHKRKNKLSHDSIIKISQS